MEDYISEADYMGQSGIDCETEESMRRFGRKSEYARKATYTKRHTGGGVKLSQKELNSRIGDKKWCQSCLKRRVNPGYKTCFFCS